MGCDSEGVETQTGQQGGLRYRERLWPGLWVWIAAVGGVAMVAIAYGSALGATVGWATAAIGAAAAGFVIARMAATIEVSADGLRAGAALLPWRFAGRCVVLDADAARVARGPQGDPTAFLLLRPGVGPGAVVVEVTDPEDPHRTWLLATRSPEKLGRAIDAARGTLSP